MERRALLKILSLFSAGMFSMSLKAEEQSTMNKRIIPSSKEELPVVGVGTWQTFDVGDSAQEREQLKRVLEVLFEKAGSVIDSSPMYGSSEKVVGDLLVEARFEKQAFLATKVWTNGREAGVRQMRESFRLLKTDRMDLMQIHNLVDWKTHLPVLRQWKEEGKIRYLGITHYHEGAYQQVEKVLESEQLDFLQINYSIRKRQAEKRLLPLAREKGVAVLINQPFESGNLFSAVNGKALPEWSKELGINSWGQYFLKFILAHPAVTCVIPGTSKPHHMIDNVGAGFGTMVDITLQKKMVEYLLN